MTLVIAQRRGDEILIMADTKVTNADQTRADVMPGRLKAVTIGPRVTVAFAGNADPAGLAIQESRIALQRAGLPAVVDILKRYSGDGSIDFILASHRPDTSLLRIRKGVPLEVYDICSLGDDAPFRADIEAARVSIDPQPLAKRDLRWRFIDRLMTNHADLGPHIGGFPIAVSATPHGHRYLGAGGVYIYKFPPMRAGVETHQPIEQVYSGDGHLQCNVVPSNSVDVPVVGVCLLQARTGYVLSPIEQPQAYRVPLAPPGSNWHGQEQQMFDVLRQALTAHVDAVSEGTASSQTAYLSRSK